MKKVLLVIIVFVLSLPSFAQDTSQHLTFKGVPIDGTLTQFVANMKAKGFTGTVNNDGTAALNGDFAGFKGCQIYVSTLKSKDLVSYIGVLFPVCTNWSTLEGNYRKLKDMLTTKYGDPDEVIEEFQYQHSGMDDNSMIHELVMERCNYSTLWRTPKGNLLLKLVTAGFGSCHVALVYYDKINCLAVEAAALDDL